MNGEYSRVNFPFLKFIKKIRKNYPSESAMRQIITQIMSSCTNTTQRQMALEETKLACLVLDKKYINYYINSESLLKFFLDTRIRDEIINEIDKIIPIYHTDYYEKSCAIKDGMRLESKDSGEAFCLTGCCHGINLSRSIFFNITRTNKHTVLFVGNGDDVATTPLSDTSKMRVNMTEDGIHGEMLRLALNLIFYMSAFPENVLNKPPDVVCDKLNINNSKTISMSKEIAEYLHENRDVSPHLRRGHFRYLGSEHYTKKRGKTIFVKPSFVKGHAVTVVENEKSVSTTIS